MAEQSGSMSDILDVVLPAFAFLASASSRYGAAGVQGMLATMGMRERSKYRKDERQRLQDAMSAREQEAALALPGKQLAAAQSGFQLGNLRDVSQQLQAPTASPDAVQALGEPTAMRLQSALQAGEQVPLPQEAPSQAIQTQRLGQMATTPEGAARLQAAGLGDIASAAVGVQKEQRQLEQLDRKGMVEEQKLGQEFGQEKREALKMLQGLPPGVFQGDGAKQARQAILGAQSQDELTAAYSLIPGGGNKDAPATQVFNTLTAAGMQPIEALRATSHAQIKPDSPEEVEKRRLEMKKLGLQIQGEQKKLQGGADPMKLREFQASIRSKVVQEPIYKDYAGALSGYNAVAIGAARGDAQGDVTLMNGMARLWDPGSVVRPSEFAIAQSAQGVLEQAKTWWPRVIAGERLTPEVRERFLQTAEQLYQEWSDTVKREVEPIYGSILRDSGLTIEDVFVQPAPIPPRGQVSVGQGTPALPALPGTPALPGVPDISTMTPADLQKLSPEQLDALEQQLRGK